MKCAYLVTFCFSWSYMLFWWKAHNS